MTPLPFAEENICLYISHSFCRQKMVMEPMLLIFLICLGVLQKVILCRKLWIMRVNV